MKGASAGEKLSALTGLRFLAALAVAVFHIKSTLPDVSEVQVLSSGVYGVGFFGFVLSYAYSRGGKLDAGEFYVKRIQRSTPYTS